ncbi:uncharacterized protein LODBEIA_P51610 [Lodderomyces beijingensis]|uniref:Uncharacterized protein n=1 Tax=Lodderomyces beijingensis TaxID=1775926 RepID=A0ABP0ZVZ7_9ASCO
MKHYKSFRKRGGDGGDGGDDELLIYLLKYLIKWFRKNFKHDSNGLRVLGYVPKKSTKETKYEDYFPANSKPIANVADLNKVIKKFQHNRDTGAQIFTALLRSLGFEARLVYSIPLLGLRKPFKMQPKLRRKITEVNKDNDLLYPYFWTELVNPLDPSQLFVIETQCFWEDEKQLIRLQRYSYKGGISNSSSSSYTSQFFPSQNQFCQMSMHYVVALTNNNLVLDVSSRYMQDVSYRWFNRLDLRTESGRVALLMQSVIRIANARKSYSQDDNLELDALRYLAMHNCTIPKTFSAMNRSPNFTTPSTLRYNEVIMKEGVAPLQFVKLDGKREPVYFKNHLLIGKSEKQWKFLGRSIKPEEINKPIKLAKASPRTVYNKRIFVQNQMNDPELNDVKLYSFAQTCPYLRLKVSPQGALPRNEYGNVEIYRPNMVPEGAVWLKLSNVESIFRSSTKNEEVRQVIDYVPVVVGFSFKKGQAYPVKDGLIVRKDDEVAAKKLWLSEKIEEHQRMQRTG